MGIRMLHRRTASAQAYADQAPFSAQRPVPAHAAAASTARIPFDLATLLRRVPARFTSTLRHAATELRHRVARRDRCAVDDVEEEPSGHRLWAELALSYLALALTLLPRSRPMPTMTVFMATADTVSERAGVRPLPRHRTPGPGATA
ncbi:MULTISPECIES: hypothetical protein [Streptomyces]|uniref:hypothetical protein n=1 Tax=Streptomyces TaxID=1883 RepID=UPI002E2601B3|nr:hypothetical protein OH837_33845 [Streptomyces canus]WSZ30391.1 hypothetical protein OG806_13570 [Streptomyces sp. NBC_00882]WSZ57163.1 hypothetical protein OH824_11690 [Streptomyces canus]